MTLTAPLAAFWAMAALAAWVQTLTGFALGLILMGATGVLGLMPLPQAAAVTSFLVILNGGQILAHGWRDLDRPALGLLLIGAVPGVVLGYAALGWLAGQAGDVLRLLLGLVIIGAAIQLSRRPHGVALRSPGVSFSLAGFGGGLMGGLFATAGPPVIWQMYRQPISLPALRVTLVAFFLTTQMLRLGLVAGNGAMSRDILVTALGAAPAVVLGTWLARHFPPPLSALAIRRGALALLAASGLAMLAGSLPRLLA